MVELQEVRLLVLAAALLELEARARGVAEGAVRAPGSSDCAKYKSVQYLATNGE